MTRFARPGGAARSRDRGLSNWLRQLSNPGRGFSSPLECNMRKKSSHFRTSSSLNMAVRGGLTRFARRYSAHPWASPLRGQRRRCSKTLPAFLCGQIPRRLVICPTGCRQLSNPGRVFSSPPQACNMRKKSPYFRTSSFSNMAVRGGFEPPIRCRIHTFQACSFSHSDTSPNCFAAKPHGWQRGATIGSCAKTVKQIFCFSACSVKQ